MEEVEWQRRIYAEIFTLAFYKQIASFPWPEKQKELVELSKILQNNSFQWKTGWGEKDRNRSENKTTEEYTCNWKAEIFSTKRLVSQTGLENHKMVNPIRISNFHEFSCHCVSWQHNWYAIMHYATQTLAGLKSVFSPIKMVEISVATSTIQYTHNNEVYEIWNGLISQISVKLEGRSYELRISVSEALVRLNLDFFIFLKWPFHCFWAKIIDPVEKLPPPNWS